MPDNQVSQTLNNCRQIVEQNLDTIFGINTLGADFTLTDVLDKVARQLYQDSQIEHDELAGIEHITSRARRSIREQYSQQRRIEQYQSMCCQRAGCETVGELIQWLSANDYHWHFDASFATGTESFWRNCLYWLENEYQPDPSEQGDWMRRVACRITTFMSYPGEAPSRLSALINSSQRRLGVDNIYSVLGFLQRNWDNQLFEYLCQEPQDVAIWRRARAFIAEQFEYSQESDNDDSSSDNGNDEANANPMEPLPDLRIKHLKPYIFTMLDVRDTQHMKRYLNGLGYRNLFADLSLKRRDGWQTLWTRLQEQGWRYHSENTTATETVAPSEIPQVEWRTTGIELEFAGSRHAVSDEIEYEVRCGNLSRGWHVMGEHCGGELVSPKLRSREQFVTEVQCALNAIARAGGRFTQQAGGHIHIDATGYNPSDFAQISRRYNEVFDSHVRPLLPRYRINNGWCRVTRQHSYQGEQADQAGWGRTVTQIQSGNRYRAVNGLTGNKPTIEYRQGGCPLMASWGLQELVNWVNFLQALHQHQV